MKRKQEKLENPARVLELDPQKTLQRIGIQEDSVLCDIGAGSGIFTIAAAMLTKNTVYALELDDDMLLLIQEKAKQRAIPNIKTVKVRSEQFDIADHSIDIAIIVAVLHEIPDKEGFLKSVKRMLKADGKTAVIEFHKKESPMGPPVAHRLSKERKRWNTCRESGSIHRTILI